MEDFLLKCLFIDKPFHGIRMSLNHSGIESRFELSKGVVIFLCTGSVVFTVIKTNWMD